VNRVNGHLEVRIEYAALADRGYWNLTAWGRETVESVTPTFREASFGQRR